jgi:hypothetical protein
MISLKLTVQPFFQFLVRFARVDTRMLAGFLAQEMSVGQTRAVGVEA